MAFGWGKWKRWQRWAVGIVGAVVALGVVGSFANRDVPFVVGEELSRAVQTLGESGFADVEVRDGQGEVVARSHYGDGYTVTAQSPRGSKRSTSTVIRMTVDRADPDPAPSPSPASAPPEPSPSPEETAPEPGAEETAPEPEPEETDPEGAAGDPGPAPGAAVRFKNCAEARAAGTAPLHQGDPGYSRSLDRDGDGVACEK